MKKVIIIFLVAFTSTLYGQNGTDYNYQYALTEAARLKVIGNLDDAIILYKKCIEAKPASSVAYYELGTIYAALKKSDLAESFLSKAYQIEPDNYWYIIAYDQILMDNKKDNVAIKICKKYLKKGKDTRILYNIAESYENLKKFKKSLKVLNTIEEDNGLSEMISLKKVEIYKAWGKYDEGKNELLKLRNNLPEAPEYNILLAEYLDEIGKADEAVKYYKIAYSLDSTNVYAITNLADFYNKNGLSKNGYYFLGRAFSLDQIAIEKKISTLLYFLKNDSIVSKDSTELSNLVQILSKKYPDNYDVNTVAYDYYNKSNNAALAYKFIQRLLQLKSDNYLLWQQALYNATRLKNYDDIIKLGDEALKIFPNKPEIKLFIGIAWYQKGVFDTAFEVLKSGYNEDLEMSIKTQYLTFLGESSFRTGDFKTAFSYFEDLIGIQPDNDMVKNNYSYYMALKDYDLKRAQELSGETIKKNPDNSTYLDTYGWILYKSGEFEQSKFYLEKALKYSGVNPEIYFHYAEVLYMLGEKSESLSWYEKAKQNGYENSELTDRIKELKND